METLNNYGLNDVTAKVSYKTRPVFRSTLVTNINNIINDKQPKESPIIPRARSSYTNLREPVLRTRTTVKIRTKADPTHRMSLNDYEKLQKSYNYQSVLNGSDIKRHSFSNLNRSREPSLDRKSNTSTPISLPIRRLDQESIRSDTRRISFREPIIKSSILNSSKEEIYTPRNKSNSSMSRAPMYHLDVKIKTRNNSPCYQSHARNNKVSFNSLSFTKSLSLLFLSFYS